MLSVSRCCKSLALRCFSSSSRWQLDILQELHEESMALQRRLEAIVSSIKCDNNNSFVETKTLQLESVCELVSQCDLLFEVKNDSDVTPEASQFFETELQSIRNKLDSLDVSFYLDSEEELGDALIYLTTGVGGDDSSDWTSMLKRMYEKWGELKGHDVDEIDVAEATHGIRSACIQICGENVFGLLKRETGVHRLVRISPFNSQGKRQTSFASVTVVPLINDEIRVQIRPSDIRIETKRASGPGGQHVNTTDSAVRITHIPTGISASASTKSQMRNKKLALDVLKSRVYEHENQLRFVTDTKQPFINFIARGQGSAALKSSIDQQNWGSQIRNYVLHPYQSVTDLRTRETSNQPQLILNGSKLDLFLNTGIKFSPQI